MIQIIRIYITAKIQNSWMDLPILLKFTFTV